MNLVLVLVLVLVLDSLHLPVQGFNAAKIGRNLTGKLTDSDG
jgi:hypothetical protein